jgi:hypothetical protein
MVGSRPWKALVEALVVVAAALAVTRFGPRVA